MCTAAIKRKAGTPILRLPPVVRLRITSMTESSKLRLSWKLIVAAYVGLSAASWGILDRGTDLSTANGRHLLAGALANAAFVILGITVTITSYRRGKRWAWFANTIPFVYGIPIICLDSYYVGFWTSTVLPQVLGAGVLLLGLGLPARLFWKKDSDNGN